MNRAIAIALALSGCAAAEPGYGVSRIASEAGRGGDLSGRSMREAASGSTLVGEALPGRAPWRAALAADGSARRLGDGIPGTWHVDEWGRLCTEFSDGGACWLVSKDGASTPSLRDPDGRRARLEPAEQQRL